ncbi:hypothetical protein JAO73_14345 [Hymenobacter sp. BT523]|uniref:hypothetical protein n=1 Tax=Hymenobacter sp. BT523 TaxID=2795725 RepID=UPI0018EA36A3|nr:hypothetical protein [Hymenobacter sp. BT523]MBJ6110199.1 hypothetical protein [Hymenobacter sp. BT523]
MTFDIPGRGRVTASSDQELVNALRHNEEGANSAADQAEFMKELAERVVGKQAFTVRTDSVHDFLFDLQLHGFLVPAEDPWQALGLEGVREELHGEEAPGGWHHRLVWSSVLPMVVSTHPDGSVHSSLQTSRLAEPGYQHDWAKNHLHELRLHE